MSAKNCFVEDVSQNEVHETYPSLLELHGDENDELNDIAHRMIRRIESHGTIDGFTDAELEKIMETAKSFIAPLPAMLDLTAPVVIFGDLHGQLADFLKYVSLIGRPPIIQYLFLGDVVDRGNRSLEITFWILCNICLHPLLVHWVRGNHEIRRINQIYGFREEIVRKRDVRLWKLLNDLFNELPVCANINKKILCMHGGLSPSIVNWESLIHLEKARTHQKCEENVCMDLMWADPNLETDEYKFNTNRAISSLFSKSMVMNVCRALNVDIIIRAHEMKLKGHEFSFDNRLLTIFSAPYYNGNHSNFGSIAQISRTLKLQILTLKPNAKLQVLKEEKKKIHTKMKAFVPNSIHSSVTCRSHQAGSIETEDGPDKFIGDGEMYGHAVKNCQSDTFDTFNFRTSKEEDMSIFSTRRLSEKKIDILSMETMEEKAKICMTEAESKQRSKSGEKSPRGSKESAQEK